METLHLKIHNIKNIKDADLELPFENGVYTFVGSNGCGKSTIMLCMAQLITTYALNKLTESDINNDTLVSYKVEDISSEWTFRNQRQWRWTGSFHKFNGLYEGSLFYGTRFEDSTRIEGMIKRGVIKNEHIASADDYVKDQLSYILHGDTTHYRSLKRLKNKFVAEELGIKNRPYFIEVGSHLISQYRMSSGECMLVSLLHFLYNSIERNSLPSSQKAIVLIDELELALHPVAVVRLMDLLKKLVQEHTNLLVYLSSHSPEVIRTMRPSDLYKVNNVEGKVTLESNCYPSYLIRDLYSNVSPDFLLLVEDELAQLVVNTLLSRHNLRNSKLIHCVPVGGCNNVLELHHELYTKKVLGINTRIISILDGDMEGHLTKEQKKLPHLFLPVPSVEKFIYGVLKNNTNPELFRLIKDKYFIVNSLDQIIAEYNKKTLEGEKDNNKNFYKKIRDEIESTGTSEKEFVTNLCVDILNTVDVQSFVSSLSIKLQEHF